jgi:hypothetical protein
MRPILKHTIAGLAAIGALASVVAGREKPSVEVVEAVARIDTRIAARAQPGDDIDLSRLERRADQAVQADPFAARSFAAPAEAPGPQASRREKPTAPPLPFRYIGRLLDGEKLAVFLAQGEESMSVSAGETLGEYRIDKVTEHEVSFTHLPTKTKQSLPL